MCYNGRSISKAGRRGRSDGSFWDGEWEAVHIRHTKLLNLVNEKKRIAVTELARSLDVSEVTIRKDLSALERRGLLRREHGFAAMAQSDDIANHLSFNYEMKRRIALRAADIVHSGETVLIESGSCCTLLAEELVTHRRDVTIITNSAFIATFVRKAPGAHVILLGGEYQNESQVMVGPMVQRCVDEFSVDKFFTGIDGFNGAGFMSNNLMRAEAIRAMAKNARRVIVLTESGKFTQSGVVSLFPVKAVNSVFTDDGLDMEAAQALSTGEIHVYTVPAASGKSGARVEKI